MRHHTFSPIHSLRNRRDQLSTTAIIFIILGVLFAFGIVAIVVLAALLLPAVQQARGAAQATQSKNNLKQIGLAVHNYHDVYNMFVPGGIYTEDKTPYSSWMTSLLPYMEQAPTYSMINFDEPWTSPGNTLVFQMQITGYLNPSSAPSTHRVGNLGAAHYAGNSQVLRDNGIRESGEGSFAFRDIVDGTSNTILAGEVNSAFMAWGDPANRRDPGVGIGNGPDQFGGMLSSRPGVNFLLCDGSVRFVSETISPTTLQQLADPNDGSVVGEF